MTDKFSSYHVIAKTAESSIITSFLLRPAQGESPEFCPGEYLILELPAGPEAAMIRREYSISGRIGGDLRITVKREPAAAGYGPGAGSTYLHDQVSVGDSLRVAGPFGQFLLDRSATRPVVLLSGGVGLTPMVAMAHELAASGRRCHFIHACEDGSVHAMAQEIRDLASRAPQILPHFCYRLPRHQDRPGQDYDSTGFLSAGTLQHLLPLDDYEVYLCGPGPFMQALYAIITDLGIRDDRIRYEFFGPATLLRREVKGANLPPPALISQGDSPVAMVHFAKSGLSAPWDSGLGNLLEFAEEQGLMPDYSCRAGTCESCKTKVISGETDYLFEPFDKPPEGQILLCCSVPRGDVTLDL